MGTCVWGFKKWIDRWILGRLLSHGGKPSRRLAKKPRVWDAIARPKRSNRKVGSQCGSNNTQLRHFSQCAFGTDLQIAMSKELLLVLEGFPLYFGVQLQRQKLFGPNKTKLSCLALSLIDLILSPRYLGFHWPKHVWRRNWSTPVATFFTIVPKMSIFYSYFMNFYLCFSEPKNKD